MCACRVCVCVCAPNRLPPTSLTPPNTHKKTHKKKQKSFYYDCLMKPNAKSVTTALRKVEGLQYNTIANGHGPLLRCVCVCVGGGGKARKEAGGAGPWAAPALATAGLS